MSKTQYYPVVGCMGIADDRAKAFDKLWLLVDDQGNWLPPAPESKLAAVSVSMVLGYLVLRAEGMLRLDIPMEVIEDDDSVRRQANIGGQRIDVVDEGDLAAAWFSNFLGTQCRLVKVHPDYQGTVRWPSVS